MPFTQACCAVHGRQESHYAEPQDLGLLACTELSVQPLCLPGLRKASVLLKAAPKQAPAFPSTHPTPLTRHRPQLRGAGWAGAAFIAPGQSEAGGRSCWELGHGHPRAPSAHGVRATNDRNDS